MKWKIYFMGRRKIYVHIFQHECNEGNRDEIELRC